MSVRWQLCIQRLALGVGVLGLAAPVALVAIAEGAGALALPYNLHVGALRVPVMFQLHMLAAGLSLLIVPIVISLRRDARLHKPLGRLAVVCVAVGGITSLPVAVMSDSVGLARAGFLVQGLVWMGLLAAGISAIRARRFKDHAHYMLAMAAVASGAIWVRLITAVTVGAPQDFNAIYGVIAWAGWLLPLAIVWRYGVSMLTPRQGARRHRSS